MVLAYDLLIVESIWRHDVARSFRCRKVTLQAYSKRASAFVTSLRYGSQTAGGKILMRVIITGGTGLIGQALSRKLADDEHEVILLSRSPEKARNLPAGTKVVAWDGQTSQGWGELANGAGAIINLAGESIGGTRLLPPRWTRSVKHRILDSRRRAAIACAEAIQKAKKKPDVFIQASAIGFYGPHANEDLTETSPPGDDFVAQVCVSWEQHSAPIEEMGVRRVIFRTGLVLDKSGGILPRLMLPFQLFAGGPLGNGKQWMSWIHLADQIGAIRFLLETETARGAFNLTAPHPVTSSNLAKVLGMVMKRPSFMPAPAFAFRLAFGEVATIIIDGQKVLPERLLNLGYQFLFPDLEPALRNLLNK